VLKAERDLTMKKGTVILSLLTGLVLFTHIQTAQARDALSLADSCIGRLNGLADGFDAYAQDQASGCVADIEKLLAGGDVDRADSLAQRCITSIRRTRQRTLNHLNRMCNSCEATLREMGEVELAQQVRDVCRENINRVMQAGDDAIAAINAALAGGAAG